LKERSSSDRNHLELSTEDEKAFRQIITPVIYQKQQQNNVSNTLHIECLKKSMI